MERSDSPYDFGVESPQPTSHDPEERDLVIIDGQAMSYRSYHRTRQ